MIKDIRPGEHREYRIVRQTGKKNRYRVEHRNPDTIFVDPVRWWQFWRWAGEHNGQWRFMMTSGLYHNYVEEWSTCHEAETAIDSDVRERIGRAEGWVPVRCANEGADNH